MRRFRFVLFAVLAVVGFFAWRLITGNNWGVFGANETVVATPLGEVLYGYLVTLVGVLLGSVYRELQDLRNSGTKRIAHPKAFVKALFSSVDLWVSLCGSPIVYALLWKSLAGGGPAGLTIVALQNGFCCTMVLGNLVKSNANHPTAAVEAGKPIVD